MAGILADIMRLVPWGRIKQGGRFRHATNDRMWVVRRNNAGTYNVHLCPSLRHPRMPQYPKSLADKPRR